MKDIQVVIYRDKYTGEIRNWHEMRASITQDKVDVYNNNDHETKAEIVTLEEKSVAHYFYTLKTVEIQNFHDSLLSVSEALGRLNDKIDECEKFLKNKEANNE